MKMKEGYNILCVKIQVAKSIMQFIKLLYNNKNFLHM